MENIVKPATAEVKKNNKRRNKKTTKPTTNVEVKEIKDAEDKLPTSATSAVNVIITPAKRPIEMSISVRRLTWIQKIKNWFKHK